MKHTIYKFVFSLCAVGVLVLGFNTSNKAHAEQAFLGQINYIAFTFAPEGWAFCDGQILEISGNQALYALLGTTYGGNGTSSFGVPDLRGRIPMHRGQFPGSSYDYKMGQLKGSETHIMSVLELPGHSHSNTATSVSSSTSTADGGSGGGTVNGTLKGNSQQATTADPNGTTLSKSNGKAGKSSADINLYNTETPDVEMKVGSVTVDLSGISLGDITTTTQTGTAVTIDPTGSSNAFSVLQSSLVLNAIICMTDCIFPSRN